MENSNKKTQARLTFITTFIWSFIYSCAIMPHGEDEKENPPMMIYYLKKELLQQPPTKHGT